MSNQSRRMILKGLAVALPATWSRPVVESVVLPAHAQTSRVSDGSGPWYQLFLIEFESDKARISANLTGGGDHVLTNESEGMPEKVVGGITDLLIGAVHAQDQLPRYQYLCVQRTENLDEIFVTLAIDWNQEETVYFTGTGMLGSEMTLAHNCFVAGNIEGLATFMVNPNGSLSAVAETFQAIIPNINAVLPQRSCETPEENCRPPMS